MFIMTAKVYYVDLMFVYGLFAKCISQNDNNNDGHAFSTFMVYYLGMYMASILDIEIKDNNVVLSANQ